MVNNRILAIFITISLSEDSIESSCDGMCVCFVEEGFVSSAPSLTTRDGRPAATASDDDDVVEDDNDGDEHTSKSRRLSDGSDRIMDEKKRDDSGDRDVTKCSEKQDNNKIDRVNDYAKSKHPPVNSIAPAAPRGNRFIFPDDIFLLKITRAVL